MALPGVQVLFAFLLTVPFAQGFGRTSDFQQLVYVVCLLSAAVATGFYIAPAAQHRVLFRSEQSSEPVDGSRRGDAKGRTFPGMI